MVHGVTKNVVLLGSTALKKKDNVTEQYGSIHSVDFQWLKIPCHPSLEEDVYSQIGLVLVRYVNLSHSYYRVGLFESQLFWGPNLFNYNIARPAHTPGLRVSFFLVGAP